jgi:hypothetical protein
VVIMEMVALQGRLDPPLADAFTASDEPERRIDIVRAYWNGQMDRTKRRLGELASRAPATIATSATAAQAQAPAPEVAR